MEIKCYLIRSYIQNLLRVVSKEYIWNDCLNIISTNTSWLASKILINLIKWMDILSKSYKSQNIRFKMSLNYFYSYDNCDSRRHFASLLTFHGMFLSHPNWSIATKPLSPFDADDKGMSPLPAWGHFFISPLQPFHFDRSSEHAVSFGSDSYRG